MSSPEEIIAANKLHYERLGKWVKYKGIWYDPLEWSIQARANNYSSTFGEYRDIQEVLQEAQNFITMKLSANENITGLLARYFAFEQKVINYYRQKENSNKRDLSF